jgi:ribosomal protein S18
MKTKSEQMREIISLLENEVITESSWGDPFRIELYQNRSSSVIRFSMQDIQHPNEEMFEHYINMRKYYSEKVTNKEQYKEICEILLDAREKYKDNELLENYKIELNKISQVFHTLLEAKLQEFIVNQEELTRTRDEKIKQIIKNKFGV